MKNDVRSTWQGRFDGTARHIWAMHRYSRCRFLLFVTNALFCMSTAPDGTARLYNFSAGPGTLPEPVLHEIRNELPVYDTVGASIMEISHRSDAYDAVEEQARAHLRALLDLDDNWHILFLQGGASMQFHQVPLNFLPPDGHADYVITGRWSVKAQHEAERIGAVRVAATSADTHFAHIPDRDTWDLSPNAAYLHITSNNTVHGTQFPYDPQADVPIVTDASSEILSRPMNVDPYGLIYAGAQKNIGPAGVTLVLVHDDFLQQRKPDLPTMLDYGTHVERRFNTPPTFPIYVVEKVCRWVRNEGGIPEMHARNQKKETLLYDRIDRTAFYEGMVEPDARSTMNAIFRLHDDALQPKFLSAAREAGLINLKGHRSVGGLRASMYNALPVVAVEALVDFMDEFERTHG